MLSGWREATVDIDIRFYPELDELYRAIPEIKEKLSVNVELAAPSDFIPVVPGWQGRSQYVESENNVDFYNYDPYSQALAKIERGHEQDRRDVISMFDQGLVESKKLRELFREIEPFYTNIPRSSRNNSGKRSMKRSKNGKNQRGEIFFRPIVAGFPQTARKIRFRISTTSGICRY